MSYPISTNSKIEGKRFLAWDSDNKEWVIRYYAVNEWQEWALYDDNHKECYAGDITRWQPLPEDPELAKTMTRARRTVLNANDLEVLNHESKRLDDGNININCSVLNNRTNNGLVN